MGNWCNLETCPFYVSEDFDYFFFLNVHLNIVGITKGGGIWFIRFRTGMDNVLQAFYLDFFTIPLCSFCDVLSTILQLCFK